MASVWPPLGIAVVGLLILAVAVREGAAGIRAVARRASEQERTFSAVTSNTEPGAAADGGA